LASIQTTLVIEFASRAMYSRAASLEMEVAIITSALGHRIVTILFYAVGILMVWMSVFLYENDLGELINVLDLASARVNRIGASTLSWQARFVQEIARLSALVFNRLLGHRLLSIRAVGVTNCLSAASVCLVLLFSRSIDSVLMTASAALFFALGIAPGFIVMRKWARIVWFTLTLSTVVFWIFLFEVTYFFVSTAEDIGMLIAIPLSLACDIVFVASTRWTLRWILTRKDFGSMLLILVLNCSMAFSLVGVPLILSQFDPRAASGDATGTLLRTLASTNVIDAFTSGLFIFFALAMLLHRLFWPFLSRTVDGLKNLGVLKWRKVIGAIGIALIGCATPAGKEVVEKILEKLL
jgi:hypothetical protein